MNPYFYMKPTTLAEIVRDITESIENEEGNVEEYQRVLRAAFATLIANCGREEAVGYIGFNPVEREAIEPMPEDGDFINFMIGGSQITGLIVSATYNIDADVHHLRLQLDPDDEDLRHCLTVDLPCSGPRKRGFNLS